MHKMQIHKVVLVYSSSIIIKSCRLSDWSSPEPNYFNVSGPNVITYLKWDTSIWVMVIRCGSKNKDWNIMSSKEIELRAQNFSTISRLNNQHELRRWGGVEVGEGESHNQLIRTTILFLIRNVREYSCKLQEYWEKWLWHIMYWGKFGHIKVWTFWLLCF